MAEATRIRLARSLPRLLALPVLGALSGGAAIAVGLLVASGPLGLVLAGAGGVVVLLAVLTAAFLLAVRLEIEEASVRIRRLGGARSYELVPGPVTRVRLTGANASRLRSRAGLPGWQLGRALLRGEERIEVVRLAPTPTAILVPTDRGRLAIAAHDEAELLQALSSAARARQRLEAMAAEAAAPPPAAAEAPEPAPAPPPPPPEPRYMTGIERARFEAMEAEEREALEAERVAAAQAAAEAAARAAAEAEAAPVAPAAPELPAPEPEAPRRAVTLGRPRPSAVLVLLPLVGAGAAYWIGVTMDRAPTFDSDPGRLTALALVLAGPVATIGAIMARVWWPRLVGVVVAGALASAVFIGRSLIGG